MIEYLSKIWISSYLTPFLGVAVLVGLLKLTAKGGTGFNPQRSLPGASVGVAFAWVSALVLGSPEFPPIPGSGAIVSTTATLLLLGVLLDYFLPIQNLNFRLWETVIVIVSGITLIAWLRAGLDLWAVFLLLIWGILVFRLLKVGAQIRIGMASATAMMIMAACGLAAVSAIAGLPADAEIAIGLAAANLGLFVWNWPKQRFVFGFCLLLAGGGALLILAVRLLEESATFAPSLVLVGFVLFADTALERIPLPSILRKQIAIPLMIAVISLLPLALAAAAALISVDFLGS